MTALSLVQIGRGNQNGDVLPEQPVKHPPKIAAADRVDPVGRLIQQQHPGRVNQGANQLQFLFHAARELVGPPLLKRLHARKFQQFIHPRGPVLARYAIQIRIKTDVLMNRQIPVQAESLAHVSRSLLDRGGLTADVTTRHDGISLAGVQNRGQHAQRRGFARAVRTYKPENLTRVDIERQPLHRCPIAESSRQVLGLDPLPVAHGATTISPSAGMPGLSSP